jgi:hypothetical protein
MEQQQTRTPVRRARRYPFTAHVELTDLQSEAHFEEVTRDLSLFGCGVATTNSLPVGAKVRVRMIHRGSPFTAIGRVVYVRPYREIGLMFTHIEDKDQAILEKWISELRI